MRIRHKVPAIFSLSMVDMLCCALGCVILVWLLNAKQAEDDAGEQRREIEESQRLLSESRQEHERATARTRAVSDERDLAKKDISELQSRLKKLEDALVALNAQLASEQGKVKDARSRITLLEADVALGISRLDDEKKKLASKDETLKLTQGELAKREQALKSAVADLIAERARLKGERERLEKLEQALALTEKEKLKLDALLKDGKLEKEKLDSSLASKEKLLMTVTQREQDLLKTMRERKEEFDAISARVARLERDKRELQVAVEARFAGIELAGERVVFLVDSSGSMEMIDDKTDAPYKWAEVRRTVGKLMDSLPKLKKFQLITFGPEIKYPLGNDGKWVDNEKASSLEVMKALQAMKPRGGTNMYLAFEAAFGFRKDGLDTIYLLSDGLPNQGEGLTAADRSLKGIDLGVVLGKHVRTTIKRKWNVRREDQPGVKIHTIGFFYESPDLGSFLWALSRENDGSFVGMSRP